MVRDITHADIDKAREAAEATGDPDVVAKTEQAIWVATEAQKTH